MAAGIPVVAVTELAVYVAQKLVAKAVLVTKMAAQLCVSGSTQARAAGRKTAAKEKKERIAICNEENECEKTMVCTEWK